MFHSFANSFVIAISCMVISVLLAVLASYGISCYRFKGKKLIILGFLITQMLAVSVLLTSMFMIFKNMNLLNEPLEAILADATIGISFSILILKNYFALIPRELEEVAYIHGGNRFIAFLRVLISIA